MLGDGQAETGAAKVAGMRLLPERSAAIMLVATYVGALLSQQDMIAGLAPIASEHITDLIAAAARVVIAPSNEADAGQRAGRLAAIYREFERSVAEPGFSLPALARRLAITPRYVQRLLADAGTSFSDELIRRRLRRSRFMPVSSRYGHLNVTEIALECGFSSVAHFHRMFRREFGETPGDVRAEGQRQNS
jgi:AraC-like DNA-binding protein